MKSYQLKIFAVIGLLMSIDGLALAKPSVFATKKPPTKHIRTPVSRFPHAESAEGNTREMVRAPHALPNGWRRTGEEVSGGTGY